MNNSYVSSLTSYGSSPPRVPLPKPLLADRIRNIQDVKLVGDLSFIDQGSHPATPFHGICWEVEDNRKVVPQNVDDVRPHRIAKSCR